MKFALYRISLVTAFVFSNAITFSAKRPKPPVRPYDAPTAPEFIKVTNSLERGIPKHENGNFLIGPNYKPAPERNEIPGISKGKIYQFSINSKDTLLLNPGIARKEFGKVDPSNHRTLIVETYAIDYTRQITVYVPANLNRSTEIPFMICHDGPKNKPNRIFINILDNLIAQKRIPEIVVIMIANGGGDAQGHQRGKEYDTMSAVFANYIEEEVLPRVEQKCSIKLTGNPDGRATMGNSSGGSAALIMAWYRNDLYNRVLTTSGTFVNQQWPFNPETPGGAWDFHEKLIPNGKKKNLRVFLAVGDYDLLNPNVMRDNMHDWVEANHRMARVLAAKGYDYQYLFCQDSGHGVSNAKAQFLPHALEWVWYGYPKEK